MRFYIKVFQAASHPDPKYDGARRWAAEMLRRRRAAGFADDVELTSEQFSALLRGTLVAVDPGAAEDAAEAAEQARIEAEAKEKAAAILAAAALRDSGGPLLPDPPKGAKRTRILQAGIKRRQGDY